MIDDLHELGSADALSWLEVFLAGCRRRCKSCSRPGRNLRWAFTACVWPVSSPSCALRPASTLEEMIELLRLEGIARLGRGHGTAL